MIGRTLSHYRILDELGRGGMGIVYRALDTTLGREVALKVLGARAQREPSRSGGCVLEARAAASLAHPAVSIVYEIDEADGATFIAMELVRGRPLASLLAEAPVEPARALDLAIEVADGLAEAHAHGVVHRDLKPKNVMLTESGHAKIIDFGLAKLVLPRPPFESGADTPAWGDTDPGRILGTAAYMSPEQVRGAEVDARSDLFAFGALLYEMLSGEPAFRRETGVETLHAVLKEPAPRLLDLGLAAAAPVLQRVLDRCLAKDPDDRYASAAELAADLREARRRLDLPAPEKPAGAPAPRPSPPAERPAGPLRVLIVDDEEPARALLREYLARRGRRGRRRVPQRLRGGEGGERPRARPRLPRHPDAEAQRLRGARAARAGRGRRLRDRLRRARDPRLRGERGRLPPQARLARARRDRPRACADARRREGADAGCRAREGRRPAGGPVTRLVVRQGPRVHVIPVDRLDYAEAQDDYVSLHSEGKSYLKQQTLTDLESSLDPARFVRIHRSYLLNLDRLARIDTEGGEPKAVVLADGTRLPLSRSGYARLKTLL